MENVRNEILFGWCGVVDSAENALYAVKRLLFREYRLLVKREFWVDHHRKAVLHTREGAKFYVLFKRDFFHSYGVITGKGGAGESLNVEDFEYVVYHLDIEDLLYVYPDGAVYKIRARDLRANATLYDNAADGKEQYLFPLRCLQRL